MIRCFMSPSYLYRPADFAPLPVKLEHLDIRLDFRSDGTVQGTNALHMTARQPLEAVRLDARDLQIRSVAFWGGPREDPGDRQRAATPLEYDYDRGRHALTVRLPRRVEPGAPFTIRTHTTCVPSEHVLEGIYLDTAPPGCPPQYMSQCQQWGFQRILPIFDDCTAKCTLVTTLEADARYTHLISNGNVHRASNPDGRPVPKPGDPSRQVITYENPVPMAPYLFLVCVGTWEVLADEVVYPSGRRVRLEYLVPPGRKKGAELPMRILKEAVLWQGETQEYAYPYDVYRTICMEKSNFGGMENVGNTTIITSAALIDEYTGDQRLVYAHGIIVHEFEHNQCGSSVTMETPFDMWLNEAFTVDVERRFLGSKFDPDAMRLDEVDAIRAPVSGPLAIEEAGHGGRVVRDGFNDPDELVDGVTYVKAAEVIRMLRLIVGEEAFRSGKNLYFSRFEGGNARTDQFFACFEEGTGRDLSVFQREWLRTIGYPRVEGEYRYDPAARRLTVFLRQDAAGTGRRFHLPIEIAAVDGSGRDLPGTAQVVELLDQEQRITFEDVPAPAFVSFNRNASFYGVFTDRSATPESLRLQVRLDPNRFNRVEAMRQLTDRERLPLLDDPDAPISEAWLETWGAVLRDPALTPALKAYLLRIDEASLDRSALPRYRQRYLARSRLLARAAGRYAAELIAAFRSLDTDRRSDDPRDGWEERRLKAVLLRTLIETDTPEVRRLAEDHLRTARHFSDQTSALHCINLSGHPRRTEILEETRAEWRHHLNGYAAYLATVASGIADDLFDRIERESQRPPFRLDHPAHVRALYLPLGGNNKMLWTERGIRWVAAAVVRLAPVNDNLAARLVACFQLVNRLDDDLRPRVRQALEDMRAAVNARAAPSVAGRIAAYLE